jgi:hypothetical protein
MFARAAIGYEQGRLSTSVESVYPYLQPLTQFARIVSELELTILRFRHPTEFTTLLPLLRLYRLRKSTDPRDKIFALLGLVQRWGQKEDKVIPNYEATSDDVFWRTSITLIKSTESLSVLMGTIGPRATSGMGRSRPSWVTDWSYTSDLYENQRLDNVRLYNASSNTPRAPTKIHGKSILELRGYEVDQVALVASELALAEDGDPRRWRAVVSEWQSFAKRLQRRGNYAGGGSVGDAFWRTLCGDLQNSKNLPNGFVSFRRAANGWENAYDNWRAEDVRTRRRTSLIDGYWQESPDHVDHAQRNAFHYSVECASGWRRFFVTKRGYIGSGPRETAAGDSVFILPGLRVPFILRSTPYMPACAGETLEELIRVARPLLSLEQAHEAMLTRETVCNKTHGNCFSLVGDAYVHQLMDGQFNASQWKRPEPDPVFLV